jgi:hypothetical protein
MPCTYLHNNTTTNKHAERDSLRVEVLKAGDKMTTVFSQEINEIGTYILSVHYTIKVNDIELCSELEDIVIEVK